MINLKRLYAREVLDSRGTPTVEVVAESKNHAAFAIVPSGASTGTHEALELRDGNPKRYFGKGVLKAASHVNTYIYRELRGFDIGNQRKLDETLIALDGTPNKSRLGANAILGVSLACAKLAAAEHCIPLFEYLASFSGNDKTLPVPFMNILNGGVHADSGLEFQEMMIVSSGFRTFREKLRAGSEIFHALKKLLAAKGFATSVGDEGGFAPRLPSHEAALDFIMEAVKKAGYRAGKNVFLALDVAASEFFRDGYYKLKIRGKKKRVSSRELIAYYEELTKKYPIISIEDGCSEDDWNGWKLLTQTMPKKIQLVGDDLFVTNAERFGRGIREGIANSILIKLNQIGTLTETIDVINQAKAAEYKTMVSHRSGETEDTTIAHLAVGLSTGQIKTGSLSRSERIAKYNELLRIEEILNH